MQLNTQKLIFKSRGPEQSFNAVQIHGALVFGVLCIVSSSHPAGFMSCGRGMGKTGLSGI